MRAPINVATERNAITSEAIGQLSGETPPELHGQLEKILFFAHTAHMAERPQILLNYVDWVRELRGAGHEKDERLGLELRALSASMIKTLGLDQSKAVNQLLDLAHLHIAPPAVELDQCRPDSGPNATVVNAYLTSLLDGSEPEAMAVVVSALEAGLTVRELYIDVFQGSQHRLGALWASGQVSVAQEHYVTAATQRIMARIHPQLTRNRKRGLVMLATCAGGELHELPLRLVADYFELDGWTTHFIGASTPISDLVGEVRRTRPHLVAISVTLRQHLGRAARLVAAIRAESDLDSVRIMVGGQPFTADPALSETLGADASAIDAFHAVTVATRLVARLD